jgi:L-ornithine N5-oxygenase
VYLQGATEHSHGIASSLLSMTAVRTGEIVQSIARRSARLASVPQEA